MNGKKCISLVLGFLLAFTVVAVGYSRITTFVNEANPNTAGTPANHTLKFTNTENIPLGGRIEVDFPAAFDLTSRSVGNPFVAADFNVTLQKPAASILPPSVKLGTVILNGNKLSFEVGDSAVDPGFQQIEIVNTKILNPSTPGNYSLQLRTYDTAANNQRQIETASSTQFEIVSEMSRASVYPEPNRAGERAQYTIKFKLGSGTSKKLYSGDRIRIEWDANLIAGADPTHATSIRAPIPKETVTVNGARPTVDPQFISEGIPAPNPTGSFCEMDIIIPNNINTTSAYAPEMTIVFSNSAGIINPSDLLENRSINVSIFRSDGITQVEAALESNPYSLNTSLEAPEVKVQPDKIGTIAEYHCAFKVGDQGKLTANSGRVDVTFPNGTIIPPTISAYSIKIATPTPAIAPVLPYVGATKNVPYDPQISGNKVSFVVPETVLAGQYVCFIFTTDAGIRNPEISGVYNLRLSTSQEPSIVTSQNYRIQGYTTTSVEVKPNKSGETAKWRINFNLRNSSGLYTFNNDTITVTFPEGTGIPLVDIPAGDITINGVSTTVPATVNPATRQITVFVPQSIEGGAAVSMVIEKQANVIIPRIDVTPKYFTIKVEISGDQDPFISDPFMIYTSISDVLVVLSDPGIGVVSQQEITFTRGDVSDSLGANASITIEFPKGTTIPPFINAGNVRIENVTAGIEMASSSVQVFDRKVVVRLPSGFPAVQKRTKAKVTFMSSCGITNPTEPGAYRLTALTSQENTPITSGFYTIGTVSGAVKVSVEPRSSGYCIPQPAVPANGKGAEYEINFLTGSSGGMASGQFVTVIFPPQYKPVFDANYPAPTNVIPPGNIMINNMPVTFGSNIVDAVAPYPVGSKMVNISIPASIGPNSIVSIKFLKSADIDNPVVTITPQPFTLYVYTAIEPSAVSGIYWLYSKIQGVGATEINNDIPIQVALSSYIAGRDCGMDFGFETGPIGALTARVDSVSIMLPQETRLPSFIPANTILVDQDGIISGNEVAVLNIKIDHNIVTFTTPIDVNNLDNLYVYFTEQSGMLNPSSPGNYQIFVKTSQEEVYVSSSEYTITPVSNTIPTVSVKPAFIGVDGIYTIKFKTGTYGDLNMGDTINLEFPADTTIPASIASNQIRVNNIRCNINPQTNPVDRTIQIYSPIAIKGNSNIEIVIAEGAYVKNPTIVGKYNIKVWTLREGSKISPLLSNEYEIYANTAPLHITIEVSPCTPYANAEYLVAFYTPVTIVANTTAIDITFPNGTFIPSSLDTYSIMFGSTACRTQPAVAQYTVTLVSPIAIGKNDLVTIKFTKEADIQNTSEGSQKMYFEVVGAGLGRREKSVFICPDLEIGRIEITPDELRIEEGRTQTFAAFVYDVNGNKINRGVEYRWNISGDIGWIGSFNDPSVEFYANSTGKGSISVTVSYGSQSAITDSASVTVVGGLENIVLTPTKVSTSRGNKTPFIVVAYDNYGELIENVSYTFSVSPALGTIQKMTNPNEITFLATAEGRCTLTVIVRQNDSYKEAQAEIEVRNGVNDLRFEPASYPSSFEPSATIGPITLRMTDQSGNLISQNTSTPVTLASSSSTTRFSQDGVTWTTSNKFFTEVSTNFSETMPFYVSELEQNNISITATSEDYNAAIMTLTIRGVKKKLSFGTPPRLLRVNKPSDPIIVNISDIFGNPFTTNRDIIIVLSADSQTVNFSKSSTTWISQNQIQIKKGTSTVEFYCMDSKEGSFNIIITHPLFGSIAQMEMVASPGSVSMPEVNVTPSTVGAIAQYEIGFTLGLDGELGNVSDTITIRFPSETNLPNYISAQDIYVNGSGLFIVPFVDKNNNFIRIVPPKEINGGQKVELIIKGITNPETEKDYHLSVFTSKQPTQSTSEVYHIGVSSLTEVLVAPNPVIAGEIASYNITFTTGVSGELIAGDLIVIVFDYNFAIPKTISRTNVVINGMIPSKNPTVSGNSIIIKLDRTIQALSENEIIITKEAGITNPDFPGMYQCRLYTSVEQSTVESEPFQIVDKSALKDIKVGLKPATIAAQTELTVSFNLGPYGALSKGENIYLSLNNFVLPEELHGSFVSVNNVRLSGVLRIKDKVATIPLSMMLANNQDVTIIFFKQAGIINPTKASYDYRISVWTDKEPSQIMSEPFTVEPTLEIDCLLTPDHPDGLSGWFVTAPTAIFTSNILGTFYYRIDNAQEKKYTYPILLNQPGRHTLYYRIVTSMGTESEVYEVDYAYDGDGPEIVTNLDSEVVYTRDKAFALSVKINDVSPVIVTLNQQPVSLIENTFFTLLSLKNGENILQIKAIDEAGNITFGTYRIIVKVNPPILMVSLPQLYQTVEDVYFGTTTNGNELHANIRIKGSTEIGIDSITVKSLTKNLEEVIIPVDSMGGFDRVIGMSVLAGDNILQMSVVDKVGNINQVTVSFIVRCCLKLRIGVENAYLNATPITLDAPPYLKYNMHTMVPFRVVAESFGATVGWGSASKKVSYDFRGIHIDLWIDNKNAMITHEDGRKETKSMPAEPELKNGRTLIPLRFVAEAMGMKVGWNAQLWEASLTYP